MDSPVENLVDGDREDPVAEFLAQEKEVLGEMADEFFTVADSNEVIKQIEEEERSAGKLDFEDTAPSPPLTTSFTEKKIVEEEPETIKKWKVENEARLKEKDEAEDVKKEELRKLAKKELEDWYDRYDQKLKLTQQNNRANEKEYIMEINDITPGTEWERVHKLCDFNVKNNRNSKDMSRMRSILLQLKQNGVQA